MLQSILELKGVQSLSKQTKKSISGGGHLGIQTCTVSSDCTNHPHAFCMDGYCFI